MRRLSHDLEVPRHQAVYHPVVPSYRRECHVCSDWVGELQESAHKWCILCPRLLLVRHKLLCSIQRSNPVVLIMPGTIQTLDDTSLP